MRSITEYKQQLIMHSKARLAWAALPRSAAALLGALVLVAAPAPMAALALWAITWLALDFLVRAKPGLPNRAEWKWLGPAVLAVNIWPARLALLAAGLVASLRHSAPLGAAEVTGWLLLEAWYTFNPLKLRCETGTWPACS